MIARWKISMVWFGWIIIWPLLLWIAYEFYYFHIDGLMIDILLFTIFICIVALFPLTINNTSIFFVNGISIAVFLSFGLFVEIILSSIAILMVMVKIKVGKKGSYRIPLNLLLFSVVSIISAEIYYAIGGSHNLANYQNFTELVAILCYAVTTVIVNITLVKLVQWLFLGVKVKVFDKSLLWNIVSSLMVLPVGLVLFFLYIEMGHTAIFFLSIPFISISIILKLLYSYQEINRYLKKTGEIGHQLAKKLEVSEVYDVFMQEILQMMPIDYAYIYVARDDTLQLVRYHDIENKEAPTDTPLQKNEAFSGRAFSTKSAVLYQSKKDWPPVDKSKIPDDAESILSIPIEYGEHVTGIVTIISKKEKAYEKTHQRIATILANYLGVAIENAKHYELKKLESEKDGLTQLYNYRYLEKELTEYFYRKRQSLFHCSMLILDIDHFKKVNDTYGHEAGNEILREIANRLIEVVGTQGLVSRYGGEEFIIFLPDTELSGALELAELIRARVEENPFKVDNHIFQHSQSIDVSITASIGVSSYPDHCEEPNELIRHADRAMYIGAKRRGRNKVAVYNHINEDAIVSRF